MKLISFDIGIRNLAYCCMDDAKHILDWDIINIIPEQPKCYISTCKKIPTKTCFYLNTNINWCDNHNSIYNTFKSIAKENELTKPTNVHIINCKNIGTDNLRKAIIRKLDLNILPLVYKHNIEYILLENQPVKKNPLMKQVMDTIYCWILIRCINDSNIIKKIHLISPSNKLKQYAEQLNTHEDNAEKYKATKNLSIDVVKDYLKTNKSDDLEKHLNKYNKKDDLCDSLLQGFYWIDKVMIETNKIKNKKNK